MKKIISAILAIAIGLGILGCVAFSSSAATSSEEYEVSVWNGISAPGFAQGSGTEEDPFIINDASELDYLASVVNSGSDTFEGKYIKLNTNINWNGKSWTPIGNSSTNLFRGTFDGNGKTIYNLNCNYSASALFGYATTAYIKNLKVDYATFTVQDRYAGGIVALLRGGTVSGCVVGENVVIQSDIIMSNTAQAGGIVGWVGGSDVNHGLVENSVNYGKVEFEYVDGTSFLGGVVGVIAAFGTVQNCTNFGTVSVPNENHGDADATNVGGVAGGVGGSSGAGTLVSCINAGTVNAKGYVGGIFGKIHVVDSTVNSCYSIGEITASENMCGTVGGNIAKAVGVCADNLGVAKGTPTVAYAKTAADIVVNDDNFAVGDETTIKLSNGYIAIETVNATIVAFDEVDPEKDPEAEIPEFVYTTTEEKDENTKKPNGTDDTTTAKNDTTAKVTEENVPALTTKAPDTNTDEGGCGGFAGSAFALVAVVIGSIVFIKAKKY